MAIERRVREPMLPLGFFRNRAFTGAQIAAFAISASFFAVFLYTTLYLQQVLGLSAIEAGLVYLPGTMTMLVVSGATASLGARLPPRTMIGVGLGLVAVGMVLFTLADVGSSWTILLPGEMIALIGTGLFNPAVSAVALGSVPMEQSGVAAGVNDTFRQAGIAVGVAALGALIPAEGVARRRRRGRLRRRPARRAAGRRGARRGRRRRRRPADPAPLRRRRPGRRPGRAARARSRARDRGGLRGKGPGGRGWVRYMSSLLVN